MNKITYAVTEETYYLHNQTRKTYGIICCSDCENNGTSVILKRINDVTSDKNAAQTLADRFNQYGLSLIHFEDAVEDFFAT